MSKGTARKANDGLWTQSSRRTVVLWNSHLEGSEFCWSLKRPWCVGHLTESVKLTNDPPEDREPTQDYHPVIVTKPKISASPGSLTKGSELQWSDHTAARDELIVEKGKKKKVKKNYHILGNKGDMWSTLVPSSWPSWKSTLDSR